MKKLVPAVLLTVLALSACSKQADDGLAVSKMSSTEVQAANFLPLNDDQPGAFVDPQRFAVRGKYTLVHYFSPYDEESAALLPRLAQLVKSRNDIAVRTINVNRPETQGIDWQSPVLENARIPKLPHFQIYDPTLSLRAQGRPAHAQVTQWVKSMSP